MRNRILTKKRAKRLGFGVMAVFAIIGFLFSSVFVSMQFGWLNVRGSIAERNQFFDTVPKIASTNSSSVLGATTGSNLDCSTSNTQSPTSNCAWQTTPEWAVIKAGLGKDKTVISDVASKTGVSGRLISSAVIPEQLRFFTSERESFKKYFEPLKVLGSMSQFSLGVSGIKQATAGNIEKYASDPKSVYYPGPGYAELLAYPTADNHEKQLFDRLTDAKNHYYSYLYTAVFLKEIESQWRTAGFDISERPDILTTLFNIGYAASKPKEKPEIGGTPITAGGYTYSFGELGILYYQSGELTDIFPR